LFVSVLVSQSVEQEKQNNPAKRTVTNARLAIARVVEHEKGLVHFPLSTQNISSYTHHIKSFDACMEH
jgi:hypothetical protein